MHLRRSCSFATNRWPEPWGSLHLGKGKETYCAFDYFVQVYIFPFLSIPFGRGRQKERDRGRKKESYGINYLTRSSDPETRTAKLSPQPPPLVPPPMCGTHRTLDHCCIIVGMYLLSPPADWYCDDRGSRTFAPRYRQNTERVSREGRCYHLPQTRTCQGDIQLNPYIITIIILKRVISLKLETLTS